MSDALPATKVVHYGAIPVGNFCSGRRLMLVISYPDGRTRYCSMKMLFGLNVPGATYLKAALITDTP